MSYSPKPMKFRQSCIGGVFGKNGLCSRYFVHLGSHQVVLFRDIKPYHRMGAHIEIVE